MLRYVFALATLALAGCATADTIEEAAAPPPPVAMASPTALAVPEVPEALMREVIATLSSDAFEGRARRALRPRTRRFPRSSAASRRRG